MCLCDECASPAAVEAWRSRSAESDACWAANARAERFAELESLRRSSSGVLVEPQGKAASSTVVSDMHSPAERQEEGGDDDEHTEPPALDLDTLLPSKRLFQALRRHGRRPLSAHLSTLAYLIEEEEARGSRDRLPPQTPSSGPMPGSPRRLHFSRFVPSLLGLGGAVAGGEAPPPAGVPCLPR